MSTTREATGEPTPEQFAELDRRVAESQAETRGWNAALSAVEAAIGPKRRPELGTRSFQLDVDAGWNDCRDTVLRAIAHLRQGEPSDDPS